MFRNPAVDLIIVLLILLVIFGPKRLPTLGRGLGEGLREFKESITGESKETEHAERPELAKTSAPPVAGTAEAAQPLSASKREPPEDGSERGA